MATKISVPDIGDFENVEIIEVLVKSGDTVKKMTQSLHWKVINQAWKFLLHLREKFHR